MTTVSIRICYGVAAAELWFVVPEPQAFAVVAEPCAEPAPHTATQLNKVAPDRGEPGQREQLRFDNAEQPLGDEQADGVSAEDRKRSGNEVAVAHDDDGNKLQRLNDCKRNHKDQERRIRRQIFDRPVDDVRSAYLREPG